jgi:chemotaxis signal transduction protein
MVELPPLATASRRGSAQSDLRLVTFTLGNRVYGIDVDDVHAIYHALPLIPAPGSEMRIKGYLRLSDKRVPVIDLRACVSLPEHSGRGLVEWIIRRHCERRKKAIRPRKDFI